MTRQGLAVLSRVCSRIEWVLRTRLPVRAVRVDVCGWCVCVWYMLVASSALRWARFERGCEMGETTASDGDITMYMYMKAWCMSDWRASQRVDGVSCCCTGQKSWLKVKISPVQDGRTTTDVPVAVPDKAHFHCPAHQLRAGCCTSQCSLREPIADQAAILHFATKGYVHGYYRE